MSTPFQRYAITDRLRILSAGGNYASGDPAAAQLAALIRQAQQLASQGVDYLQLREKDLPAATIASLARNLRNTLRGFSTRLLINSRADIAVATASHGVHLTSSSDELTPRQGHDLYATANLPPPIVTISCHTLADVTRHRMEPVAAILFGPVFEKVVSLRASADSARLQGTGLEHLHEACQAAAPIPVYALGGLTSDRIANCLKAGASGVAGIRLFSQF